MLILTRGSKQEIIISGNIYVRVLGVRRDRVKIGISAPMEVTVLRQELLERGGKDGPQSRRAPYEVSITGQSVPGPVTTREEPPGSDS
ncbi:MAG: carbon storage regulator [Chloroflexi bacterium]|nr:carbon storage regulator [Chloroflexota bacterium]